jgi:hypothetical protein
MIDQNSDTKKFGGNQNKENYLNGITLSISTVCNDRSCSISI